MRTFFALALLANACCSHPKPAADAAETGPPAAASSVGSEGEPAAGPDSNPIASPPDSTEPTPPTVKLPSGGSCKLAAPKISEDSCNTDSDCGVSAPCHAEACVAKSKSDPPKPDTMCTMSLACHTADANRCGCYQGHCALIPPPDKTQ